MEFSTYLMCIIVVLTHVVDARLEEEDWIQIGRCRAHCLSTFLADEVSNDRCISDEHGCLSCWRSCEELYKNAAPVGPPCLIAGSEQCNDGCVDACDFLNTILLGESSTSSPSSWSLLFPPEMIIEDDTNLPTTWSAPFSTVTVVKDVAFVYLIVWRPDVQSSWNKALMTSNTWANVKGPHTKYPELEFRLIAINTEGVVVDQKLQFRPETEASTSTASTIIRSSSKTHLVADVTFKSTTETSTSSTIASKTHSVTDNRIKSTSSVATPITVTTETPRKITSPNSETTITSVESVFYDDLELMTLLQDVRPRHNMVIITAISISVGFVIILTGIIVVILVYKKCRRPDPVKVLGKELLRQSMTDLSLHDVTNRLLLSRSMQQLNSIDQPTLLSSLVKPHASTSRLHDIIPQANIFNPVTHTMNMPSTPMMTVPEIRITMDD